MTVTVAMPEDFETDEEYDDAFMAELEEMCNAFLRAADFDNGDRSVIVDLVVENGAAGATFLKLIEAHKQWARIIQDVFDRMKRG